MYGVCIFTGDHTHACHATNNVWPFLILLVLQPLFSRGPMGDTETTAAHAGHLSIHHIVEVENEIMTEIVPLITQVLVIAGTGQGLQNIHPIGDSVT